jgi:hypothetical protein
MKNSLRISTFIIALVVIIAGVSTSHASGTRMGSLGMTSDTFWMIQKDTAYSTVNPGYYVQFPALITFNETSAGSATGGIWLKPMDDLMVVLNVGGSTQVTGDGNPVTSYYGNFQQLPTQMQTGTQTMRENINVNASYKMGPMSFGLRYGTTERSLSTSSAGVSEKQNKSIQTVQVGMFMDLGGGMDFDAAAKITMFDYSLKGNGIAAASVYKADTSDLDITARFNMGLSENNRVHVWLRFNPMDRTDKLGTTKTTYTIDKYSIGVSDELKFTQAAFAYFGLMYELIAEDWKQSTDKVTVDTDNLIFVLGAQASLTKSLTMTVGSSRTWNTGRTEKSKSGGVSEKIESNSDGTVTGTWGLQWKKGHWTLEAGMTRSLLTAGPNFISGATTASWASNVNLAYIFGNTADLDEVKK